MMLGFQLFTSLNPAARTAKSPGGLACRTSGPLSRVWTSSVGSWPLGPIYNPTPSLQGSTRSPALLCQVLKERFLKMEQLYVPHPGALNELFIEKGGKFSPLTAQSTQSRGQPTADRSTILAPLWHSATGPLDVHFNIVACKLNRISKAWCVTPELTM